LLKIQVIDPPLKEAFKDAEFIKSIIETAMSRWEPNKDQQLELTVLLPENKESELQRYFIAKSEQFLNQGVDLCFEESMHCGFRIGPKDGGYVISFSDQDFENFFRAYLRPKMIRFLYGGVDHE
jgi:V/A-type H+/Na+-transporting ATPase subunit E